MWDAHVRSFKIFFKCYRKINNVNITISEFTRGPLQEVLRAACCTSMFYVSFGLLANIQTGRKEIRKTEREKGKELLIL